MKRWFLRMALGLMIILLAGSSFVLADDELPQLPTPTELTWSQKYYEENGEWLWNKYPGNISWKVTPSGQDKYRYKIIIYDEQGNKIKENNGVTSENTYINSFMWDDFPSGRYYFTVQSIADKKTPTFSDSEIARSDYYDYTMPDQSCIALSVSWEGNEMAWTNAYGTEGFGGYLLSLYKADSVNGNYKKIGGMQIPAPPKNAGPDQAGTEDVIVIRNPIETAPIIAATGYDPGEGYYRFKIRVLTNDVTKYTNGPWSELSEPYYFGDPVHKENHYVKVDIDRSGTELSVIATVLPVTDAVNLLAATYDENGRFLGFDMKKIASSETEQSVSLAPEKQGAAEVKLLVMNEDLAPVDEALEASF